MAKASFKRIDSSNKAILSKLRYIVGIPAIIYGINIFILRNRNFALIIPYFITLFISLLLYGRLYSMGKSKQIKETANVTISDCGVDLESTTGIHQ